MDMCKNLPSEGSCRPDLSYLQPKISRNNINHFIKYSSGRIIMVVVQEPMNRNVQHFYCNLGFLEWSRTVFTKWRLVSNQNFSGVSVGRWIPKKWAMILPVMSIQCNMWNKIIPNFSPIHTFQIVLPGLLFFTNTRMTIW